MITRSGRKVPYIPQIPKRAPAKRRLQAEGTIEDVTVSATGKGTHTRWLRLNPETPPPRRRKAVKTPAVADSRFVTPEPFIPTEVPPPPKRQRLMASPLHRTERIGPPGIFNLARTRTPRFFEGVEGENGDVFIASSPDGHQQRRARVELGLGPRVQGQPMVGPDGTLILDEQSQPMLPSPSRLPGPTVSGDTLIVSVSERSAR
ncbi:hypothetical protein CC1G_05228 [Coprinopsis cinerea okayama7|uniref:Uncharacterized protein n=1 Tax=Coprinopsis cinerea (strain Okayama-7 / 130 / ATCC MYA-4618 / FGSC 9003) TaxID=240176 RepID=A8PC88_COPC7|nr:hypothetical protein CC1G_05228 [Coprinopsis cinerea okayama7\|eukprot:XP_001840342.1 hypothetical protein CC1G_05228 [Coprinopsis cinerea okayama7\